MLPSAPYTITELLSRGSRTVLYRAVRNADGCRVVLKVLDMRRSRPEDRERLKHEYELGKQLHTPAVVRALALDAYQGMPALVMEDFGGQPLDALLGAPMAMDRFLPLALGMASALADLHEQGVVHKDLKPHNILVNLATGEIKIADFGLASRLPREHRPPQPADLIEGSLPYLSPEQTGRTHRAIDSRADLYSLGVTFHQMLTGELPFAAKDPVGWVHCHVARAPPSVAESVPEVPETLARIVLKLLSKMPEDRYQHARGLRSDLERCLAEWRDRGRIDPFPLGERDASGRLQNPEKLYGRAAERALLLQALGRVVDTGTPELLLVSGYSGIGKSALVRELEAPVARARGSFISGKFDQYKREIPYATLVQAFVELVLEILAESEPQIAAWRQRLHDALGAYGQLIADVIPQVELVIGRQPPAPELPPAEAQHRFRLVFRRFIGVFAQEEHPLVLFLDDLQWADSASLGLLADLVTHATVRHILVVGAFRDNEVTPSHPLVLTVDDARGAGARVTDIVLGPIAREDLGAFIAEALHCRPEEAAPLAALVHEKTAGNPFFAIQFLNSLGEEGLIRFDGGTGAFRWDVTEIRKQSFTDNVVELMVGKLKRLSPATQEALKQLACLGNTAEDAHLTLVQGGSEQDAQAALAEAVQAGLVLRMPGAYKFLHDRVQEAAYSLIPGGERAAMHLGIGRQLASRMPPEELAEKIFEVVNQLDRGAALITSPAEREQVAELNLIAGKRAKGSTAYASALTYFAAGAALLPEDSWERRYDLAFALEFHRAECEFLTGELAAAEQRLSTLSPRAGNLVDSAAVTCVRMALYLTLDRSDHTIEVCLEYLRRVDVQWSPHPAEDEVRQEYERLWRKLGSRAIEELIDLPPLTDPAIRATMDVLMEALPPAMFSDKNLLFLVIGRMGNLSLEHGNCDASSYAYVWIGMILGPHFGDYRAAFRFGKLGFDLVETRGLDRFRARVYLAFWHSVNPWTRHVRTGLEWMRRAFDAAQEAGDLTFAAYVCMTSLTDLLFAGEPLGDVQREAERGLEFVRKARFGLIVDSIMGQLGLVRTLRGLTPDFGAFDDAEFDEGRFERHLEGDLRLAFATCLYWTNKLQARYFAGDHRSAAAAALKAEPLLWSQPSQLEVAEYHFFSALTHAAQYDAASSDERPRHLAALAAHHHQIEVWAENCPENFGNRAALCAAELARIGGRELDAMRLYEQAIRSARDNGFVHNEALAHEIAARFYRARGFDEIADTYLRSARAGYARWGADGKVKQIDQQHPRLFEPRTLAPTATVAVRTVELDLYSVTKASQTISGELVLDKLVRTLLEVVLEQGGAQRACLVLCHDTNLSIEAEATLEENGVVTAVIEPQPVASSGHVPVSLVRYVERTKQHVILGDAAADAGKFAGDAYFARHRPKSVLCLPILRQSAVAGLLYLENNLLAGAFTPERLAALSLLATQAAISLDNAQLLAKERAARDAAEDEKRRSAFLAEAGALLAESLDYEKTFAHLAQLCVRGLADWCTIDVVEGREIRRLVVAHRDPAMEPMVREIQRRYPPRWDSPNPAVTVLRTHEPLLTPELPDEALRAICHDEEHLRLVRALGTRTGLSVPLIARGQTFGVLSLASAAPGCRYGPVDLELAQEVAHRAAMALDNARLYRASQEAVRVRSEFLTVASHELNTPITSLMLAIQSLHRRARTERPMDPQTANRMLELVSRQGERLTRLINDLLDISRIETGPLPLALTDVDLGALVHEVVKRFEADLSRAHCDVSIHDGAPVVGRWDQSRIDRVISNLLANAIKFGAGHPIEIFLGAERGVARLAVRDHGIGIDPDKCERIFERFERAVSERHYGGLGLGLYICRRIVEDHGGSIRCDSRPGAGATFIVELPRAGPPEPRSTVQGTCRGRSPGAPPIIIDTAPTGHSSACARAGSSASSAPTT
ncbi:AAA family ATPase [Nannocystis pusilla]|uniref:sensor histidine kinase n=1 Tax=Nannocystis pusilla TaxID=889268 RepID=UPI003BF39E4B